MSDNTKPNWKDRLRYQCEEIGVGVIEKVKSPSQHADEFVSKSPVFGINFASLQSGEAENQKIRVQAAVSIAKSQSPAEMPILFSPIGKAILKTVHAAENSLSNASSLPELKQEDWGKVSKFLGAGHVETKKDGLETQSKRHDGPIAPPDVIAARFNDLMSKAGSHPEKKSGVKHKPSK